MEIKNITELVKETKIEQKILIVRKEFYEKNKEEIDNLMKNNYSVDLTITNTLDKKTDAIVMDKNIFYGIDYGRKYE